MRQAAMIGRDQWAYKLISDIKCLTFHIWKVNFPCHSPVIWTICKIDTLQLIWFSLMNLVLIVVINPVPIFKWHIYISFPWPTLPNLGDINLLMCKEEGVRSGQDPSRWRHVRIRDDVSKSAFMRQELAPPPSRCWHTDGARSRDIWHSGFEMLWQVKWKSPRLR